MAFAAYAWTASPVPGWLDSSELTAAAASLGVAHSPGHPIAALLGRAATLLPLGDQPFRVALSSGIAIAAAAAAAFVAMRRLAARLAPEADAEAMRVPLALAVALGFAASGAAWLQAVRAEVYGLEIALLALATALLLHPDDARFRRDLPAAALAFGLALANHHYMTLLYALPAAAFALARAGVAEGAWRRHAVSAALALFACAAAFAYLPLRAAADPLVNWGDPDTLGRFVWTVSARAFQKSLGAGEHTESRGDDLAQAAVAIVEQISWPALLALALGVYAWLRRGRARAPLALLVAVAALAWLGRGLLGFDFDNPDALGYLLPAVLGLLLVAGGGLAALIGGAPRPARHAALLLAVAIPVFQLAAHARASSRRHAAASDAYAREVLETLPPRAVVVTSYFQTAFQLWALESIDQARPDVAHLDRGFHTYPGFEAQARRRHPDLASLVDAGLRVGAPPPLAALDAVAARRPIHFELATTLDDPLRARLEPRLWLAAYSPGRPLGDDERAAAELDWEPRAARARARLAASEPQEPGGHRLALWHAYLRVEQLCATGRRDAAAIALAGARALAGDADPELAALAARCNLAPR